MTDKLSFLVRLLARANRVHHALDATAKKHGINLTEFVILNELTRVGETTTMHLHSVTPLSTPAGSVLLGRMEASGLIYRESRPPDRRISFVRITDKGRRVHDAALSDIEKQADYLMGATPPDLTELTATLNAIGEG